MRTLCLCLMLCSTTACVAQVGDLDVADGENGGDPQGGSGAFGSGPTPAAGASAGGGAGKSGPLDSKSGGQTGCSKTGGSTNGSCPSTGGASGMGGAPPTDGASGMGGASPTGGATSSTGGSAGGAPAMDGPSAGNPNGSCSVPADAALEPIAAPRSVVGTGTAASCTSAAVIAAVAKGGVITFDCGASPKTIVLTETAKIVNDTGPKIVIDGGNKITLSGGAKVRILYQNTCDEAQKWTSATCNNQDTPQLTVQNITFADGNSKGVAGEGGGGAIYVRGGRFKAINTRFFRNVGADSGQDVGGGAVRVLDQYQGRPVYIVNSTFGGEQGYGNTCSNGGAISSIGVSFTLINSLFAYNRAIGVGANPARAGTAGGGSGGAIYNDGNTFTLSLCGTDVHDNTAKEGGGAIFFVSNNRSGSMLIRNSSLSNNPSLGFETAGFPGIFVLAKELPQVTDSVLK